MSREVTAIDISDEPVLLRLAEEVRASNEPRILRRGREELVIVVPAKARRPQTRRKTTEADHEAFRSAAGGWKDVDTDKLIADIYADRARGDRPPVDL